MRSPTRVRSSRSRPRLPVGLAAGIALALATTLAPAQSFLATASGQLSATAAAGPTQSYSGPITATTTTVQAYGTVGISSASATLTSSLLTVRVSGAASASASATISLNLQGPVGAGARVQIAGGSFSPVPGNYSIVVQGQPHPLGVAVDYLLPPGGLPVTASASVPYSGFYYSSVNLDVTWSYPGVAFAGAPTPGCLGPAVAWTRGVPQLGNAGFGITCSNAHPFLGAVSAIGLGGLSTPFVYDGVNVWVNPNLPIGTLYIPSNAAGAILHPLALPSHPSFVGLTLFAQWIVFEPPGCMPLGLSGSNAIRFTVLQ